MAGMLTFKELQTAVGNGEIDTVVVAFADMQGRLVGKRMQAEYFLEGAHEETHGCDYLLANDIDMEPVPGYAAANWEKGYGDFVMKPDMTTLRRLPWLPGTALVLADVLDHHTPRGRAAWAPRDPEEADRAPGRCEDVGLLRFRARVLPLRRDLRERRRQGLCRPEDGGPLHRGLPHPADHQGGGGDAGDPHRPAGRRHPGRELKGRMGAGPGGDQRPLCRRADHGRPARHPEERVQGDRAAQRQGDHLHGEVALRPRRQFLAISTPRFGMRPARSRCSSIPRTSTGCRT